MAQPELHIDHFPESLARLGRKAKLTRLYVSPGDEIKKDQKLAGLVVGDYELEWNSEYAGVLKRIFVEEGQALQANDQLWEISVGEGTAFF